MFAKRAFKEGPVGKEPAVFPVFPFIAEDSFCRLFFADFFRLLFGFFLFGLSGREDPFFEVCQMELEFFGINLPFFDFVCGEPFFVFSVF